MAAQLHDRWPWLIEHELDRFASLEREGKTAELDEIRSQAPKAIPGPLMRTLWRLLLSGRVKSPWRDPDLYRWKGRLKREGLTTTLRLELRELLAPQGGFEEAVSLGRRDREHGRAHAHASNWWTGNSCWPPITCIRSCATLPTSTGRLPCRCCWRISSNCCAMHWTCCASWVRPTTAATVRTGICHRSRPHWQNRGFRDWVSLIELLRDAWLAVRSQRQCSRHTNCPGVVRAAVSHLQTSGSVCCQPGRLHRTRAVGGLAVGRWCVVAVVCGYGAGGVPAVGAARAPIGRGRSGTSGSGHPGRAAARDVPRRSRAGSMARLGGPFGLAASGQTERIGPRLGRRRQRHGWRNCPAPTRNGSWRPTSATSSRIG